MRARSRLFEGIPGREPGLYDVKLPPNLKIEPVFAEEGGKVKDFTEGSLSAIPDKLASHFNNGVPMSGTHRQMNFWKAIATSSPFVPFEAELRDKGRLKVLLHNDILEALNKYFPRFPGDHNTVIEEQFGAATERSFLRYLEDRLTSPDSGTPTTTSPFQTQPLPDLLPD